MNIKGYSEFKCCWIDRMAASADDAFFDCLIVEWYNDLGGKEYRTIQSLIDHYYYDIFVCVAVTR